MPPLLNQRHEAFARLISRGEPASRAYSSIYHVTGNVAETAGARLLRNVQVGNRIAELKRQAARRTEKTVASLVQDLDNAIEFALKCKKPSAVVAAIALQARLLGLEAPRQLEVMHRPAPLPTKLLELTEEEWLAQFSTGTATRPALTEGARQLKAKKRNLNGRGVCPAAIFDVEDDAGPERPVTGVIDLYYLP
ncbi:terminase small subunit [Rhizobium sp. BK661]|uniref:terminase small subunit n=1 Tax=Rhizobium sp. BK661 TaxID=2586991 RepID=UPI0021682D27|nr:terminase small subunit [Rhizobium sp. BK661]MCS3744307.1 hypothetical protein [Rhizobium sp. BK661]